MFMTIILQHESVLRTYYRYCFERLTKTSYRKEVVYSY